MFIESLEISDFGFFSGVKINLADGLNLLQGNNESGKSTAADFIRFIFYGFSGKPDRERHIKLTSKTASGSLILNDGGKRYRIERHITGAKETCGIYELGSGTQCFKGEVPGEVFFGIPSQLFDGTVFIGQKSGSKIDGKQTAEAVDNLLFAADENINVKKALKRLDEARVELLYKNEKGGRIYELSNKLSELRVALSEASSQNAEIISLRGSIDLLQNKTELARREAEKLEFNLMQCKKLEARQNKERLASLRRTWQRKERELEEFRLNNTRNGYFPDARYYETVRECSAEFARIDARVRQIEGELSQLSDEMNTAQAEREENTRLTNLNCRRISGKRNLFLAMAIVLIMLFLPSVIAAVFLLATNHFGAGCILAGISAAALVLMVAFFVLVSRYTSALRDEKSKLGGTEDVRQFRLDQIRSELDSAKSERAQYRTVLTELCGKWGYDQPSRLLSELRPMLEEEKTRYDESEKSRFEFVNFSVLMQTKGDDIEDDGAPIALPPDFDKKEAEKRLKLASSLVTSQQEAKHSKELRLASLSATAASPSELEEKITALECQISKLKKKYNAYVLAEKALAEASEKMRASVSPRLSAIAGELMGSITEGKYSEIGVDSSLGMTFRPEIGNVGKVTADDTFMSAGTADAAYISLRLALAQLISGERNPPPVILDESFSRLDDTRLYRVLKLLLSFEGQVIILVSSDRERRLLGQAGDQYNEILLGR